MKGDGGLVVDGFEVDAHLQLAQGRHGEGQALSSLLSPLGTAFMLLFLTNLVGY